MTEYKPPVNRDKCIFALESQVIQALVVPKGMRLLLTSFSTGKSPFPRSPIAFLHGHIPTSEEERAGKTLLLSSISGIH